MGVSYYIEDMELKATEFIDFRLKELKEKDELYLDWECGPDLQMDTDNWDDFKWDDCFEKDLIILQGLGVRGDIEISDEFHGHTLYKLKDVGVCKHYGSINFPDVPDEILKQAE